MLVRPWKNDINKYLVTSNRKELLKEEESNFYVTLQHRIDSFLLLGDNSVEKDIVDKVKYPTDY